MVPLERHATGSYFSCQTRLDARPLKLAFPAPTLERLLQAKERADAQSLFRDNLDFSQLSAE